MSTINNGTISLNALIDFAKTADNMLQEANEDDAAFYFAQLADFLKQHPEKGLNEKVGRILGL